MKPAVSDISLSDRPRAYVESPTDRDYAAAAREALRAKDMRLAIEQASAAVVLAPQDLSHVGLLDEIIAKARAPLLLVELPREGAFFGLCAARARVLARLGRTGEALDALLQVAAFRPRVAVLPWALRWVAHPKGVRRVDPSALAARVFAFAAAARDDSTDEGTRANLEAALALTEKVAGGKDQDLALSIARARLLRALGRTFDALSMLEAVDDCWEIALERAALSAEVGDGDGRIEWLSRARDGHPDEASIHLELGDALVDEGQLEPAAESYGRALRLDAGLSRANISAEYARALLERRADMAFTSDVELREREQQLISCLSCYETRLPDPIDPVIAVIRRLSDARARVSGSRRLRIRTDGPLCPSARRALEWALEGTDVEVSVMPDREELTRFGRAWDSAREAGAAGHAPSRDVVDCVQRLAAVPFSWTVWCDRARQLASSLDSAARSALEGGAVYLDQPESADIDVARYVHAHQVAAALLIGLGPDSAATRLARLEVFLEAHDDWSAAAGVLGLRALGESDPSARARCLERLVALLPRDEDALPPFARALAVAGGALAVEHARQPFFRLRARARRELAEYAHPDG
jgi:tetratricopeptide (TPR) repeat protein